MELTRIVICETNDEQVIVLKEKDGDRQFPIQIGIFEAAAIDRKIRGMRTPRPLTHDLLDSCIRSLGASLTRVVVCDLSDGTFFAKLHLEREGKTTEVDARPSDAIALAIATQSPIFVEEKVFETMAG
ncbi:MAG: bifunctional nuclease family protein [Candidatus Brocadiae bacterium]|nr:bifunctional nuclease family protein [Candidatus Brocadiia bacterium]